MARYRKRGFRGAKHRKSRERGFRYTAIASTVALFLVLTGFAWTVTTDGLAGIQALPAFGMGKVLGGDEDVITPPVFVGDLEEESSSSEEPRSESSEPPQPSEEPLEKPSAPESSEIPEESSETPEDSAGEDASEAVSSGSPEAEVPETSGEPEITPPPVDPNGPEYQKKYPDMFVPQTEKKPFDPNDKVVYLTFDDGPSALTEDVLNILDEYGVKATFFVVAKDDETSKQRLREIADRGHAIGLHSYTHDYRKIYASVDAFLDDFAKEREIIYSATGEYPTMFRFPGGSVNSYNKKTAKAIIDEMTRRGYTYYDWNVSSGDAEYGATRESIYRDTITQTKARTKAIVLCHDTNAKGDTVSQLPAILKELKQSGYRFDKLDPSVAPINFPVPKS
mgnify:FL=1